jgi:hypothetical protein
LQLRTEKFSKTFKIRAGSKPGGSCSELAIQNNTGLQAESHEVDSAFMSGTIAIAPSPAWLTIFSKIFTIGGDIGWEQNKMKIFLPDNKSLQLRIENI